MNGRPNRLPRPRSALHWIAFGTAGTAPSGFRHFRIK